MELDRTDRDIIRSLERDARMSLRSVAEEIGVSLGTVSNRLKRLEDTGVVKGYRVEIDPDKVGWGLTVVVGLRIEKGRLLELQRLIAEDSRVLGVYDVTGEFDSMILARAKDRSDLDDLSKTVLSMDGIMRSVTHFVLNTVKEKPTSVPEISVGCPKGTRCSRIIGLSAYA